MSIRFRTVLLTSAALVAVGAAARSQAPAALPFQRWVVAAAKSEAGFNGSSSIHDFTGKTRTIDGEIHFDPRAFEATAGGAINVDAASLDTDNKDRDAEMRKRLATDQFPKITFALDQLNGTLDGMSGAVKARGKFTIHGVTRERTFDVRFEPAEGGFRVRGDCRFKMTDHGIEPPVAFVVTTSDDVKVFFDVLFQPVKAELVTAQAWSLDLAETLSPTLGEPATQQRAEMILVAGGRTLWYRPGLGLAALIADGRLTRIDLHAAATSPAPDACDAQFGESRGRLASMKKKLDALPADKREAMAVKVKDTISRLESAIALAPETGLADVQRTAARTTVRLGATEWASFDGTTGDAALGLALCALDGLPASIRAVLADQKGVPATFTLRAVSPAGSRSFRGAAKPAGEIALPAWMLDPASWTHPAQQGASW